MEIRLYNSLTKSLEPFTPVDPTPGPNGKPIVRMYTCGPTVYDFAHIGNFTSFLFADTLRRSLELLGYDVRHVMNITDVGHMTDDSNADGGGQDKMQAAAERIKEDKKSGKLPEGAVGNPNDPVEVARYYEAAFKEDARKMRIKVVDDAGMMPRATEHIDQMQQLITKLIDKGHAYVGDDGVVYFSVESFPAYGRLSGNTLDQLKEGLGGRISEANQQAKKHPADFLLWKADESHIMKWASPWGAGYPGWHIECSAMAWHVHQAEIIDIHTGGEDNIFPHHECEIAQSCSAHSNDTFAKFFMHARFLLVDGEKMSKSKGNFYTVRDVLEGRAFDIGREVDPAVLRFAILRTHYRQNKNFTKDVLSESAGSVKKIRQFREACAHAAGDVTTTVDLSHPALAKFAGALADDLNVSQALAALFEFIGEVPTDAATAAQALAVIDQMDSVLGVIAVDEAGEGAGSAGGLDTQALCAELDQARKNKDYSRADEIRDELQAAGYEVKTTKDGTVAEKMLA